MIEHHSYLWKALEFYGTRIHHRGKWRIHNWLVSKLQISCDRDFEVQRLGLRWILNPSDFVQSSFYWTGEFETWDWLHLSRMIRPESIVCDIGANFGFYSVMIGRRLKERGRVFAFEPCAQTLSRLRTNVLLNSLERAVTIIPVALSDKQGYGYLGHAAGNSGARSLSSEGEKIVLDTLDHFCERQAIAHVDLLKIDVEGHEMAVLNGAAKSIETFKPIVMIECNPAALQRSGSSAEQMANRLRCLGYRLFSSRRKTLVPLTYLPVADEIRNIFALPG